jgi:diguanylate cyclase (GGDEF)-like protein
VSNFNLRESIESLAERAKGNGDSIAENALIAQFNHLLKKAQENFPERIDLIALPQIQNYTSQKTFLRATDHLLDATKFLAQQASVEYGKFQILRAENQLAKDFKELASLGMPVGFLFFDIDHFKGLNTKHTETLVDLHVLEPFMIFVEDLVKTRGYGYSVGGDEFIVLLGNTSALESEAFANRLLKQAAACRFDVNGIEVSITLSIGTCCTQPGDLAIDEVRKKANEAENSAKKQGRNCVVRSDQ